MKNDIRIASDIAAVPKGANCAIIIRHGDRDGVLNQVVHQDERLNVMGIQRSEHLGTLLSRFSQLRSFTSPIERCVDTCVHISKGYGKEQQPERTELLGMAAPFMLDPKKAYKRMNDLGLHGFVECYINDSLDRSMVLPCNEGTRMLFSYVIDRIKDMEGGIGVFVTHDMIITPSMAYYFDYDFMNKGLAPFLDGIVLYEDGKGYVAAYSGKKLKVDASGTVQKD
jgi:hypothetical protein